MPEYINLQYIIYLNCPWIASIILWLLASCILEVFYDNIST